MALAYFRVLIHYFLNKDRDVVPKQAPLIILDSKSDIIMANIVKDTKHTRHIFRRIHFVSNGEECHFHKTVWCEVDLQLVDTGTRNVRGDTFNRILVYAVVRLDN